MIQDKSNLLDSGFTRQQTEYALKKARIGYDLSNKENNVEGKKYYAWIIYKLERELGIRVVPWGELAALALDFFGKNPKLFKNEVRGEEVLNVMIEKGYMPDKPIKTKKIK
jgi:hypothetical protein